MLAGILTAFKNAYVSGFSGNTRPSRLQAGGLWIDTSLQAGPNFKWSLKIFTGLSDIEIMQISVLENIAGASSVVDDSFSIENADDDAVGAIIELIKNRADGAQVLNGDTVAEMRFVGRTNSETNPTVAFLRFTATDSMTEEAYGGTFLFGSTPDATSTLKDHFRFIDGVFETVAPHKINSQILGSQEVETAATIAQLSASKALVEMTGSTATSIQGIDSGGDSKVITIHNKSSAVITLKDQDENAAEEDILKLPGGDDIAIDPDASITLFYGGDSAWKVLSVTSGKKKTRTISEISGLLNEWEAPADVTRVRVTTYVNPDRCFGNQSFIDRYGNMYGWTALNGGTSFPVLISGNWKNHRFVNPDTIRRSTMAGAIDKNGDLYMWGSNNLGQLGVGDTTDRSTPTLVSGNLKFTSIDFAGRSTTVAAVMGLTENGDLYTWGGGALGIGSSPASTPTLVQGGLKFEYAAWDPVGDVAFGLTEDGSLYTWGSNNIGQLGVGDTTARSTPTAVVGGIKFKKVIAGSTNTTGANAYFFGIALDGTLYAWGDNNFGTLGVGDQVNRSSPTQVLSSVKFKDISAKYRSALAIAENGDLYGWGLNSSGQLGTGSITSIESSPVAVQGGLKFKKAHSTSRSLGVTEDGKLYVWGQGAGAWALGESGASNKSLPTLVAGGPDVWEFATATALTLSLAWGFGSDGTMYAWGDNSGGLGTGDTTTKSSPTLLATLNQIDVVGHVGTYEIDVEPGDTYRILLGQRMSYFGKTPIGINIDKIKLEYES